MLNSIIFYSIFGLMIIFLGLTLWFKNIFLSLLSAMCVFFLTSIIFYILGSEYNAVIQFAIYGLAIPIVLGIGIMFTDFRNKKTERKQLTNPIYLAFLSGGIFILGVTYLVLTSIAVNPDGFNVLCTNLTDCGIYDSITIFANGIFIRFVFAFELISVILTMIAAGYTIFKRRV